MYTLVTADVYELLVGNNDIHASHAEYMTAEYAHTLRQLQLHTLHAMLLKSSTSSSYDSMFMHMHCLVAYMTHPSGFTLVFNSLLSV